VKFGTENSHQNSSYKKESKEPFQGQYKRMISTGDPYAFISDLFDVAEAFNRSGLRFIPGHILPAMLLGQQIKMKLQLFFDFTVNLPAVPAAK
jgi:hypothetical protein